MSVTAVAVSGDGEYVVATNTTGVYFFNITSPVPIWWNESAPSLYATVAISDNGDYVAVGRADSVLLYFDSGRTRSGPQGSATWSAFAPAGGIAREDLDMSADGSFVVMSGSGTSVYYWAGCSSRAGGGQLPSWSYFFSSPAIQAVDISDDGKYVAVGGYNLTDYSLVAYFKNADTGGPASYPPTWMSTARSAGGVSRGNE